MMKNILYKKIITTAYDSVDGESPSMVIVTEENNCYIVWFDSYNTGRVVLYIEILSKDFAIEKGVEFGKKTEPELLNYSRL